MSLPLSVVNVNAPHSADRTLRAPRALRASAAAGFPRTPTCTSQARSGKMGAMQTPGQWLSLRSKPVRRQLFLTVLLGETAGVLLIFQTSLLVVIANGVIFDHRMLGSLVAVLAALLAVIVGRGAVSWGSKRAAFWCAASVKRGLRGEIIAHLGEVGPVQLIGEHAGEIANTAVDGVEELDGYFARYLPQRAIASLLPLTILAVVFPLDWISGITLFVTALFIPVLMILIGQEAHERNQRLWSRLTRMSSYFLDVIQGLSVLKMFGAARREAEVIAQTADEYRITTMGVMRIAFASALMLELVSTVSIAIVAITSGLRMLAGHMPYAHGYFVLLLAPEYFLTLRSLGTQYHARMAAAAAAEHVLRLLSLPRAFSRPRAGEDRGAAASARSGQTEQVQTSPVSIALDDVSARYPALEGQTPAVLRGINLHIAPGERVAIVGRSGAGKSTLVSLLLRFLSPSGGEVRVDGRPLEEMDSREWLRKVAWLPQRPTMFRATVEENIRVARPDALRPEIEAAARLAHADDFIRSLPFGYDTVLGERGAGVSGGQIQTIALARLFLRPAALLLLDEPTAHLDREAEERALDAIGRLSANRSVLFVTHRIDAAKGYDRVVVIDGGTIAETGSYSDLLSQGGILARLASGDREAE